MRSATMIPSAQFSPPLGRTAANAIPRLLRRVFDEFGLWWTARQLGNADESFFKDIGVARGNVDWLVRNGRGEG